MYMEKSLQTSGLQPAWVCHSGKSSSCNIKTLIIDLLQFTSIPNSNRYFFEYLLCVLYKITMLGVCFIDNSVINTLHLTSYA